MRALPLVVAGAFLSTCAAFAAEPMTPSDIQATFFDGKPFTAATTSGTQFKMIFTADSVFTTVLCFELTLKAHAFAQFA